MTYFGGRATSRAVRGQGSLTVAGMVVAAEAARRFLCARHWLMPSRSVPGGLSGVRQVLGRFGSVQFDPVVVAGRNHDLALHARVAGYQSAWCDQLYQRREIFETTNKALSLVPMSEMPFYRYGIGRKGPRFHARILAEHPQIASRVLERIRLDGPLSTSDFVPEHGAATDWFGMPENVVRAVLESYTVAGVIGLARRDGNRRYYDLLDRLLPADIVDREVSIRDQLRHRLLSRYRAHGLLGSGGVAFDRIAAATPTGDLPGRNQLRQELIEEGALARVKIEGVRGERFVLTEELPLLQDPPPTGSTAAFLPPFDAMLWDHGLLEGLFGFRYVWEGFFPPAKRRWGYYVLPIVFADRFVGRIEPSIDRSRARIHMLGAWWENGFNPRRVDGFVDAMRAAITAYRQFVNADTVEWAPHLDTENQLFHIDD